jgi:hypothetical protein
MTEHSDLRAATSEFTGDDAGYLWWRNTHPNGLILTVRARTAPMLHRVTCKDVDRDRHPGRLKAAGSRQICAETAIALRAWLGRELPEASSILIRCPKCAP